MAYELIFPESYSKRAMRFLKKHPELVPLYEKTLRLLELNPYHPSLRLHALSGRLRGVRSVSITMRYRITLEFLVRGNEILLVDIGDHDVYR